MAREQRSRITLLLPAPRTQPEYLRIDTVLTQLIEICGGVTVSSLLPSVFDGWWIDGQRRTIQDANVLILADALIAPDARALNEFLDNLKRTCQQDFGQDVIWLAVHPIERIATDDPH